MWSKVADRTPVAVAAKPNVLLGAVLGVALVLTGVVGFAISAGSNLATPPGHSGHGLGGLHCLLYAALGIGLLVGAALGRARQVNTILGAAYLVLGVVLLALLDSGPQLLTLHDADNVAHLAGAALLLGFGRTQQ
ncbi:MAG: DUF4383 domain-containing protein [Sporichthyaceae bacterium]